MKVPLKKQLKPFFGSSMDFGSNFLNCTSVQSIASRCIKTWEDGLGWFFVGAFPSVDVGEGSCPEEKLQEETESFETSKAPCISK